MKTGKPVFTVQVKKRNSEDFFEIAINEKDRKPDGIENKGSL